MVVIVIGNYLFVERRENAYMVLFVKTDTIEDHITFNDSNE